jgi:hypothetical protein
VLPLLYYRGQALSREKIEFLKISYRVINREYRIGYIYAGRPLWKIEVVARGSSPDYVN